MKDDFPALPDIKQAHNLIKQYIHRTPVLTCRTLNNMTGCLLFFKCENFQKAGAFKFRGATNAVFSLNGEEAGRGVLTHSSGNHAGALSLAASMREIPAYIVMPKNAPQVKKAAVQTYGGIITECEPTLAARESTASEVQQKTGATLIHPYNNETIIAGQGTAAVELFEEVGDLDIILTPVGGGGLLSGSAIAAKSIKPTCEVYGCEPEKADDAFQSFHANKIIPVKNPDTIADGLRTSLGDKTFPIIKKCVNDIVLVSEENIINAMKLIWERMKIIVEPSGVVPLAAVLTKQREWAGKKIGLILSGGNVDVKNLPF